jgi:hypothetical protein
MAESMPACTVDSTGSIVAVRRAWRDVGQLFERALVVFAFVASASFVFIAVARGARSRWSWMLMLPAIGARDPEALDALVERLEHHGFDHVILVYPLNDAPESWYTMEFGTSVADAIARNYTLVGRGNRTYVYAPRAP